MEFVQMTLNDWMDMKQKIKMELQGVKKSFVRIGYALRKIDDQKLYEQDGYKSIAEFAKMEYGLGASTVSRFMNINKQYSVDGYSEHLREEYLEMSQSQLEEMLILTEEDRKMIKPETARQDIRELKSFCKTEPETGIADDIRGLIERFYECNEEILNELYSSEAITTGEVDKLIEIVNPSGNKSFKKGLYFLMMYEDVIKIKRHGEEPRNMTWSEFFAITKELFDETAEGPDTYKKYFGKEEQKEEQIPGQMEVKDYPELMPENTEKTEIAPAQKSEKPLKTPNEKTPKIKKTEDQKYNEKQSKIDRETKEKLQEMEDKKKMEVLPSEMPATVHQLRIGISQYREEESGIRNFTLIKDDNYRVGHILEKMEFDDGKYTGRTLRQEIIYKMEEYTGLVDGYCILGTRNLENTGEENGNHDY